MKRFIHRLPWSVIANLGLVYLCYAICRGIFIAVNHDFINGDIFQWPLWWQIVKGSFRFDSSAIFYTNILYLLLVLLPLHLKETAVMQKITKWVFVVVNSLCVIANLCDCVYYSFTQRRTTISVLQEFGNNDNIGSVVGIEMVHSWYLVVAAIALTALLWRCYTTTAGVDKWRGLNSYYINRGAWLLVFGAVAVMAMRGDTFKKSARPLAVNDAHQYVENPSQAGIVVNTPFSILRTAAKKSVTIPRFYASQRELDAAYSPVHIPADSVKPNHKNVVILIVESFAEEFVGARNHGLDNGTYKGYTTFTDSLLSHALTWQHTYCNSWVSIDAMPAVLASIPKVYTSFVLSPYSLNNVPGIAKMLKEEGYSTGFFHGAENSSMGFHGFANSAGFDEYYGRTEYDKDPRFGGEADFDGTWAIWDEEFLQFFAHTLSEMKQPFVASVFTATSHHPFALPERYKSVYLDEGKYPIHKCVRYTDNAIRQFFAYAKTQPWYDHTIFVITADHASSRTTHDVYQTTLGGFRVPIIFFDPSGQLPTGTMPGIAQQADIMPTLLGIIGYDKPYMAFGKDMLRTPAEDTWAFNYHNVPQYIKGDYLLQYDGFKRSGIYKFSSDSLMQHNLLESGDYDKAYVGEMERELQGILQSYDTRMRADSLVIK